MSAPQFSVVAAVQERPGERALRLMAEARNAAREQIDVLERAIADVMSLSMEIAEGGEAYPAGVRDVCRRLSDEVAFRAQTLEAIMRSSQESR